MRNRYLFERLAARALAMCEEKFPIGVTISTLQLLKLEEVWNSKESLEVAVDTIRWLEDQHYLRLRRVYSVQNSNDCQFHGVCLTQKGLAALDLTITVGKRQGRAGELLREQLQAVLDDSRKETISRIVGTTLKRF
jgi:hypothetical protein